MEAARTPLLLDVVLFIPRVAVPSGPGAPAAAAVAPAASAPAAASDAPAPAATAVLSAGVGRGTHKCEVDLDGLVEQLGLVGAVDGGAGLGKGGVLDQRVALLSGAIVCASGQPTCVHTRKCGGDLLARERAAWAYLDVTAATVQVEVQVLDLTVLAKGVVDCLLINLLVQVCHDNDPALYGAHSGGLGVRHHVVDLCLGGLGRAGLVDVHLHVGHHCLPAFVAKEWGLRLLAEVGVKAENVKCWVG